MFIQKTKKSNPSNENKNISIALALSLIIHIAAITIKSGHPVSQNQNISSTPYDSHHKIQAKLVSIGDKETFSIPISDTLPLPSKINEEKKENLNPEIINDHPPELISPIADHINFPITPGFMIIKIDIDQDGNVESTEVIYTELSRHATKNIEKRFAEATYQPAVINGRPERDSMLVKIDIPQP